MSLSGISGQMPDLTSVRGDTHDAANIARRDTSHEQNAARVASTQVPAAASRTNTRGTGNALSPEAPEGTDPALWSILTRAERAFFARTATAGPLTYGKVMRADRGIAPSAPTARGGRVDVRV